MTRHPLRALAALALTCAVLARAPAAQCPEWEPDFGFPGAGDFILGSAVFDDGTGPALYVIGDFASIGGVPANRVAKWDGASWSALGNGITGIAGATFVRGIEVYDDGSGPALYVSGMFNSAGMGGSNGFAKWDGTSWSSLASPGDLRDMAVFDDGSGAKLYMIQGFGLLYSFDGVGPMLVGVADSSITALGVFDDGGGDALYLGGSFDDVQGTAASRVAKFDGTNWSALGGGLQDGFVNGFAVWDDGQGFGSSLFVLGGFAAANGAPGDNVAAWNGTSWRAVGGGRPDRAVVGEVFDDGGGDALYVGEYATGLVARWDGTAWSSLGGGLSGSWVAALETFDPGGGDELFAGGLFDLAGPTLVANAATWDGGAWSPAADGGLGTDERIHVLATFDDGSGPALYAGGAFGFAGSLPAPGVARWDGSAWSGVGGGVDGDVLALAVWDDGSGDALYVGGSFTTAGGAAIGRLAKWDGASWSSVGTFDGDVTALFVWDDGVSGPLLYAGGAFTQIDGAVRMRVARRFGGLWQAVGAGFAAGSVTDFAAFDGGAGEELYASGETGFSSGFLRRFDGTVWNNVINTRNVRGLAAFDDGGGEKLYAGGAFTAIQGTFYSNIVAWDGAAFSAVGSGFDLYVADLAVFDDGTGSGAALYAGGAFEFSGGDYVPRLARWDGTDWGDVDGSFPLGRLEDQVLTLHASAASLWAGGDFRVSGDVAAGNLARWGSDCPCPPIAYCTAGTTGNGCNAAMTGTGVPSATAGSGFDLVATSVDGQRNGILFYGVNGRIATPWGASSSFLCVRSPVQRTGLTSSGGTVGLCDGALALDWNAWIAAHPAAQGQPFTGGETVWAQGWFRDVASPKTTSLSDAIEFQVCP